MTLKDAAARRVNDSREELVALSRRIHATPELGFEEEQASGWLAELLDAGGFAVEAGVCDLPTAFVARAGSGPLHVAFVAEYDCLPGIGHACGHNAIGAMSAGAGLAAAAVADDAGLTVSVIGTPAQENGGGKILMQQRGAFDGVHAAMMAHPAPLDAAEPVTLAMSHVTVHYSGTASHASMFPELGVNAADALTVAQCAIGVLRQQLRPADRIHGVCRHGGDAPHVIPDRVEAEYMIRARDLAELAELEEKVRRCFEAGSIASGTELEIRRLHEPYAELHLDGVLSGLYRENAAATGRTFYEIPRQVLERAAGATDLGNVSLTLPTIHPGIGLDSFPAVPHMPDFAAVAGGEAGDRAVVDGAIALAQTAIDAAQTADVRERLLAC
jgi:amidohydrolase